MKRSSRLHRCLLSLGRIFVRPLRTESFCRPIVSMWMPIFLGGGRDNMRNCEGFFFALESELQILDDLRDNSGS